MGLKKSTKWVMATLAVGASVASVGAVPAMAAKSSSVPPLTMVANDAGLYQENFNPFSTSADAGTIGLVYEPLFYFSRVNGKTYPLLGTKYNWSNGDKTLVVNLRKGVKWSDGKPFTADDVIFTFNEMKQWPGADGNGIWTQLKDIKKVNNYQVNFDFKQVNTPFSLYILQSTAIVPQHIFSTFKGDVTKLINNNPIGTGPYLFDKFSPQAYFFKANPHYWGGAPAVQSVEYPAYNGNDSWDLAFAAGKILWGGGFIANIDKVWQSKDPQHRFYWFPPDAPVMMYTNLKDPLLSDVAIRKAMSMAINRDQLGKIAEYGYEQPASPTGLILPNMNSWLDPKLKSQATATYDPAQAQQILDKAGYKKGSDGIYVSPSGKPLSFDLNVVAGWTDWDEMATMIAQMLGQIGIKVNVRQLQFGDYFSQQQGNKYQMSISWSINAGNTPFVFFDNLLDPRNANNFEKYVGTGAAKVALNNFMHTANVAKQKKAAYQLEKVMLNEVPSIPLVYGATWYEYDTRFYTGWPSQQNPYVDPAPYTNVAQAIVLTHLKPVK